MKKICVIKQPAGLGDIFFTLKIAKKMIEKYGCDVWWPVIPEFEFIKHYIQIPGVYFCTTNEDFPLKDEYNSVGLDIKKVDEHTIIPLSTSGRQSSSLILKSKYELVGLSWEDWMDNFDFKRNEDKENKLYHDVLGLDDDSKYVLINDTFASPPAVQKREIPEGFAYPVVKIKMIDGYTPFDWCKVLENAQEIHTVDTCFTFLIEKLNTKAKRLYLYSRNHKGTPSYDQTSFLWKKDWSYNK